MNSASTSGGVAFTRRWPGVALGIGYGVMGLLGVGLAASPQSVSDRPFGLTLAIVWGWLSYRGFRGAAIAVDSTGLRARGLLRTHRWPLEVVARVSVAVGQVGLYERAFICIALVGRPPFRFGQFNTGPRRRGQLDQVAADINAFLVSQHDEEPAG